MNSRFVLALVISAGMALLVTGIFYQLTVGEDAPAEAPTTEVVTAAKDLEIGASITPSDLRVEAWPSALLPEGSFTEPDQVLERTPMSTILAGEPILERRLAAPGSGLGLAPKVPEGMRALSVRVDDVIGVAGFVLPEARVDLLITGMPPNSPQAGQMTRTILGNIRVLSAGEQLAPDATGKPQKAAVVTLLLTPHQAEMVTLAQAHGRIQLVLRNAKDEEVAETDGVREGELFGAPAAVRSEVRSAPIRPQVAHNVEPAPPPPVAVEIIKGNKISVQEFPATNMQD
ncbi:MAG: Flp pilus assembly protein CpaB [Acidobacteria bacterium]|nr:Flp pilus assembly protein CpaB [Acidobacteriota bacterium]